jgi:glycosyltransferase involved in cell wall biosynthesis
MATELAQRGHEVKLITTSSPKGKRYEKIGNLGIFYLEGTRPGRYSLAWWRKSLESFKDLHSKYRFDVIFSESTGALSCLKAKLRGEFDLPVVMRLPGTALRDAISQFKQGLSLKRILAISKNLFLFLRDRKWVRCSDVIITYSQEVSKAVLRELCVPEDKVYTVPKGVDIDRFSPDIDSLSLREEMDLSIDVRIIVCVSRLSREKGIHILLKAISELIHEDDKIRIIIIGNGNFGFRLKKIAHRLGLSNYVIFKGGMDHDNLPRYYTLADIFIMPTLAKECIPWTILEAMATARPVIASRIGGIPSIIDDGQNGLLFTPGDISELKGKLQLLLDNPDLRRELGQKGRQKVVAEFNQERMVDATLSILERYAYAGE